jgi:hypothetical protein
MAWAAALLLLSSPALAARAPDPKPGTGPLIYLYTEAAGERGVEAADLTFVHFETTYRRRAAPRSQSPSGERIEIVERRKECRCVRLADYSRIKMSKIREIALSYPPGSRAARVRLTLRDGRVREYLASDLYGGDGLFPPRFAATLEGAHREFPLVLGSESGESWPEESLSRILLVRPRPPKR